jgi:hypothetical protein
MLRPCDGLITRPRSPTVCKMIMKLKNHRPGPKGAVEPVKKQCDGFLSYEVCALSMVLIFSVTPFNLPAFR